MPTRAGAAGFFQGISRGLERMMPLLLRRQESREQRAFAETLREKERDIRTEERGFERGERAFEAEQGRTFQETMMERRAELQEEAGLRKEEREAKRFRDIFEKADLKQIAGKHPVLGTLALRGDTRAMMGLLSQRAKDDVAQMQDFVANWRQMTNEEFVDRAALMKPMMRRHGIPIRGAYGEADMKVIAKHLVRIGVRPEQLGEEGQKIIAQQETRGLQRAGRRKLFLEGLEPEKPKPTPEEKAEEKFRTETRLSELYKAQQEGRPAQPVAPSGPTAKTRADVLRRLPNEQRIRLLRSLGRKAAEGDERARELILEMGL